MLGDYDSQDDLGRRPAVSMASGQQLVADPQRYMLSNPWADEQPQEGGMDLARLWQILRKHRWVVVVSVIVALAIGLSITLLMTPIFKGTATLKIDRETARVIEVGGVEPQEEMGANEEFFQTQYGLLKSRTLAMNVIDRLGYASSDTFFKAMGEEPPKTGAGSALADRRRRAADIFQANLDVAPVRGSRLVKVSFSSPNRDLSAAVANATGEAFIESNLNRRYESSSYARDFLEKKLAEAKIKLESSEQQVADYATREKIINIASTQNEAGGSTPSQSLTVASLVALNEGLAEARGERIKAEQRWQQSRTAPGLGLAEVLDNPTVQDLSQAKAKLNAEYQDRLQELRPTHPQMVQMKARIDETDRQIQAEVRNVQSSLQTQYEIAVKQEQAFETQVKRLESSTLNLGQRSIQYGILQREADTNRTLYEGLLQRYKEIGVTGGISTNNISIVDRAEIPRNPSKPQPLLNMLVALVGGLGIGTLLAFLTELLDQSIATPEDIESKLGLALLGSVPKLKGKSPAQLLNDPRSPISEAYYSIRTALQFSTANGAPSSLLVTSSRPSEGKSTSALAIARNFAGIGMRVLLVDGDLRNPSMHKQLGFANTSGLSNILTGSARIDEVAIKTDVPNLTFVACGPLPPNPAELLAGDSWAEFLREAKTLYNMIVVDGPPVLGLADAPTLAASIAGTAFVVESRGTRSGLAKAALQRLKRGNAHIVGGVLTKFDVKRASNGYGANYAYAYEYNYGESPRLADKS